VLDGTTPRVSPAIVDVSNLTGRIETLDVTVSPVGAVKTVTVIVSEFGINPR